MFDVFADDAFKFAHALEDTATNTLSGYGHEPAIGQIEPGRRNRNKVEMKTRMFGKPVLDFRFLCLASLSTMQ